MECVRDQFSHVNVVQGYDSNLTNEKIEKRLYGDFPCELVTTTL